MTKRRAIYLGSAGAAGAVLAILFHLARGGDGAGELFLPLELLGSSLRRLSQSGWAGNLAAWAAVLLLSSLPLLWLLRDRKEAKGAEDGLLWLMALLILAAVYVAVNPASFPVFLSSFFSLAACGCLLSAAVAWLAIKLLREMERCAPERLSATFALLLTWAAVLMTFGAAYAELSSLLGRCADVLQGNSGNVGGAWGTCAMLLALALMDLVPSLLGAVTLLWGADLARVLVTDPFGEKGVALCGRTARSCRLAAQAAVLIALAANLTQLLLLSVLAQSNFQVHLPLTALMLAAGLFLLCRFFQQGRQLREDNDSII